jgi:hypothetical protein
MTVLHYYSNALPHAGDAYCGGNGRLTPHPEQTTCLRCLKKMLRTASAETKHRHARYDEAAIFETGLEYRIAQIQRHVRGRKPEMPGKAVQRGL